MDIKGASILVTGGCGLIGSASLDPRLFIRLILNALR